MAVPYVGEIQQFGFNYAPKGTALCDGQLLSPSQFGALYSLIQLQFGGNGTSTFQLPDLRGRVPVGPDNQYVAHQGAAGGSETVTLTAATMPNHNHSLLGANVDGDASYGIGRVFTNVGENSATQTKPPAYGAAVNLTPIAEGAMSYFGGGQAHENMQPFLTICFTIALEGIYPQRS